MKKIDFIIENLQVESFIKDIKNDFGFKNDWCQSAILKNTLDYNDLEYQLSYLKFFYGDLKKTLKNLHIKNDELACKTILNFFKKKHTINKKNIDKYFVKKKIYNLSYLGLDFSIDSESQEDEEISLSETLAHYVDTGIFFQKSNELELIHNGQIKFGKDSYSEYEIICFFSIKDKKFHLLVLYLEPNANDSYVYIRSFKNKPNFKQIKSSINLSKDDNALLFYSWNKKHISSYKLYDPIKEIKLDSYWKKELKLGLSFERVEKKIFKNEENFFHNFRNDSSIVANYIKKYPEKYLKKQNPSDLINDHFKEYPLQKFKKFNFFKYIMSEQFNYRNDPKFLYDIIHSKDDLEGLLSFVPIKTQEHKLIAEEIRILKMLRTKDKKFLIKIFNTNKQKLYDLAVFYMPKCIFNDSSLVFEMCKIDTNIIDLIGDKLKKNKKFMKKIWE